MRKFRMYNVKFTIISLAAIFVMFAAPTTASAAPTATISGPASATINQTLNFSAQVYNGGSGSIYATRPDNASFTCPSGIVTDSQGRRWCILNTFTYSTSGTASFTPRETGTYTIVANAYTNSTASFTASNSTECTGNPYTYNTSQWSDCGSSDNITLNVTPSTPTNFSASCPVPGSTANLSWNSSSGAGSYTVYGFDLAYGSPNWSQCGSNGMVVCQRVTTTSTSASNLTPRANYQWYVFACVGNTNTCSAAASTTATCTPPNCNTNLDCDLCSVPVNTCSTNNGTQTCYYRAYTGGGTCNVTSFNQSCTRSNCSSGYTCSNGTCIPPPPTPTIVSNSCPAPGTTASVSWNGVSGASRYDVYAFDLSYGSPNWSACGQNGLVVCQQVTSGTSYSFSTTAGKNYQWFVNACNSAGCSPTATSTFTCTPPNCNTNLDCDLCSVPVNTCSTNNGTQTCYYRAYTGGGTCNVVSFNQSCTRSNCSSGYTCSNGTCVPPPPTAAISAPSNNSSATIGQSMAVNATANGTNLKSMDVYRIPSGADPSVSSNWTWTAGNTNCGGASTCAVNSSWTPSASEGGQWIIAVNAFDNYSQQCSGMPSTRGGYWTADCNRNGSTSNVTVKVIPSAPTINSASCPVPGSTASLSWSGVSGASRYDVFGFDLAYGSPNWSACGQNGLVVCQQVTSGTSYSFSTTAGKNYQWYVYACNSAGCSSAGASTSTPCLYNNAQYVSQSCPPSNMTPGQTANVSVIMNNSGNTTWPASSTYRLGSQNPQDNTTWGFGRIIPGSSIPPGSNYTFSSTVTAPSSPGTYNFQWRMVQEGVEWFGGTTPNCSVTVAYPPPRASVSGLSAATVGYTATFNASLTGSAQSGQIWITKGDGRSTFSCPQGPNGAPYLTTNGLYYWCPVARQDNTTSLSGTYQFVELGTYTTVVNAFSNAYQAGTDPSDQCSGTPASLGFNSSLWSDCGASDTFTTTINRPPTPNGSVSASCIPEATISWAGSNPAITYVDISEDSNFSTFYNKYVAGTTSTSAPSGFNLYPGGTTPLTLKPNTTYYLRSWNDYDISYPPSSFRTNDCPPRGSVSGPSAMAVGDNLTFSAALSGSARSGQIWITKGDGRSTFSCPQGEGGVPYRATTGYYWCPVARQNNTTNLSGTYTFAEPGSYTSVVNAFSNPYQLGTGPSDECSGTPSSLGFDASKWSDCGANDNITTINAIPQASVTGPSTIMRGETATYTATLSGGARSAALWITKGDGRSVFPCPTTIYYATTGRFWCNIGSGSGSTVTGTYPFVENGAYTVVVNAYANTNQTGTGPSDQCSGTPTDLGVNSDVWSDCGGSDNVATTVTYGPAATLTGSSRGTKGAPSTFTATLLGSAQSALIWITKGNGRSNFYCNGAENNATPTSANPPYYWCNIGSGTGSTVTGSYTFPDTDRYTAVVNAFTNSTTTYTANPSTECTGTPTYLGFNSTAWSDCGANDFVVVTSSAPTATNCGGGTSPRAEGLVTSPLLETGSKFGTTTTGRCVVDSATQFQPFKIPSYEDLKFIYYTQSKASKTEVTPPSGTANQGTLRSALNNYDTVLIRGNLNIGANLGGASKTAVVFVDGDLNIDTPTFIFGDASSGLVFVVGGNVIINRSVTRIDAVIISGGTIYTADAGCSRSNVPAEQLVVNGSLVSLDTGNMIFCRVLSDNLLPAEKINSDPKYLVILRDLYADIVQRWSEIP